MGDDSLVVALKKAKGSKEMLTDLDFFIADVPEDKMDRFVLTKRMLGVMYRPLLIGAHGVGASTTTVQYVHG